MVLTRRQEQLLLVQEQLLLAQQQQQQEADGVGSPASAASSPLSPRSTTPRTPHTAAKGPRPDAGEQQQQQQQEQQTAVQTQQRLLKSALKAPRPAPATDAVGASRGTDGATPLGQGIKKRVRIHSSNNIVHVFGNSGGSDGRHPAVVDEEDGESSSGEGDGNDRSRSQRGASRRGRAPVTMGTPKLLHYQAFIRGVMAEDGSGGGGGEGPRTPQQRRQQQEQPGRSGNGFGWGAGRRGGARPAALGWAALASTFLWMLTSSAVIFVNKGLMVDRGFRFPCALTAIGQAMTIFAGLVAGRVGLAPMRPHPSLPTTITLLFPVAFCTAASLILGNYAYLGLSVAFINILKALTPALTLGASIAMGLERPSLVVAVSLALIAFGTAVSTSQEAGTTHFSWLAFASFLASILFEALRVVFVERMMARPHLRYNSLEVLVYIGPLTLALLAGAAAFAEWEGLVAEGFSIMVAQPWRFLLAATVSCLVNVFSFLAIQTTSSLTFKVAGCLKNVAVVWLGVLSGDHLTGKEAAGFGLSMLGFLGYILLRARPSKSTSHAKQS